MLRMLTAPAIFAVLLTPAVDHSPGPVPGPRSPLKVPEITVVAADYQFTAPSSVAAGPTAIRLVNRGKEIHHVVIFRMAPGMTTEQLAEALKHPGPPPDMTMLQGGPNAVNPGGSATAIVDLAPGNYALLCFVPAADGTPHVMKGMIRQLTVTEAETKEAPAAPPAADLTIHMADYNYTFSQPITAGEHRVLVHDGAQQWHELVLFRLDPGKSGADFVKWAQDGMKTAPPGTFEGGVSPLGPDGKNTALLNFRRGKYLMICFLEDAKDGKPHFMHGMMQEITVN